MKKLPAFLFVAALAAPGLLPGADWNQWRGPLRNGVLPDSPRLLDAVPAEGLQELWASEEIPSGDEGGLGSVVTAGGKAFLSLVWHRDVPSETRTIDELVLRKLGHQGTGGLGKELVAKMETTRETLNPTLRGKKLDEFIEQWITDNLDKKQKQLYGGFIGGRFRKGKLAIPLADYDKIQKAQDKPFASAAEFQKWIDAQEFPDHVKQAVLDAVPPTRRVAEDTVVCLDLATGKTVWKAKAPGEPRGRSCSSTPAVIDGKVFALGSAQVYCLDASTGKQLWATPLPGKAPGSSPLVSEGVVVANVGKLAGYDAASGRELWRQEKVGGGNSSPVPWSAAGRALVLCNSRNEITAVDLQTGAIVWATPGGGDSTPAISGDILVAQVRNPKTAFAAVKLSATGAERLWSHAFDPLRTQSSPIVHDGLAFLMDDNLHYCWELATGKLKWEAPVPSTIASPALADGKIFVLVNNGNNLQIVRATGAERVDLGKANVRATWCPSPTVADGKLLLRMKDRVKCFNLAAGAGKS